jgi:hypothetical protein
VVDDFVLPRFVDAAAGWRFAEAIHFVVAAERSFVERKRFVALAVETQLGFEAHKVSRCEVVMCRACP